MSIKIMSEVWEKAPCEGNELLVLLAFADYADDDGYCWPSQQQVAKKCRVSESTVTRSVKKFIRKGIMSMEPYRSSDGKWSGNNYRIESFDRESPDVNLTGGHRTSPDVTARASRSEPSVRTKPPTPFDETEEQHLTSRPPVTPDPKPPPRPRTAKKRQEQERRTTTRTTPIPKPSAADPLPPSRAEQRKERKRRARAEFLARHADD